MQPSNIPGEEAVVTALCEWAVSVQRWGEHRGLVVSKLLERRQTELVSSNSDRDLPDEKDSVSSAHQSSTGTYPYQNLLFKFLDAKAPVIGEFNKQNHSF